tara:strand:+ start:3807 stop:4322 length:516 start_codon:yes stop_codon:yes gene_type:complete
MGLQGDIYGAFEKSMGGGKPLDGKLKKNAEQLSKDLTNAFVNFLLKQEFKITKLESKLDVESIKTTGPLPADVKEDTLLGPYAPILSGLRNVPVVGTLINEIESKIKNIINRVKDGGASLPALNLEKNQGQGGSLIVSGNGVIDEASNGTVSQGRSRKTQVKLFKNEVKDR